MLLQIQQCVKLTLSTALDHTDVAKHIDNFFCIYHLWGDTHVWNSINVNLSFDFRSNNLSIFPRGSWIPMVMDLSTVHGNDVEVRNHFSAPAQNEFFWFPLGQSKSIVGNSKKLPLDGKTLANLLISNIMKGECVFKRFAVDVGLNDLLTLTMSHMRYIISLSHSFHTK